MSTPSARKPPAVLRSAQREWQLRRQAEGRCITCGQPRGEDGTARLCRTHAAKMSAWNVRQYHKKYGGRYWQPGMRGRRPKYPEMYGE